MNKKGFTLIELIIAIAIGLIIMLAIYAASEMGQRSSTGVGRKVVTQQDVRSALDLMAMEISMASFNPTLKSAADNIWKGSNCATVSGNQGYKGLQIAKSNEILIEMDITKNGVIGEDNEIIHYIYDKDNNVITRNTCGGDQPFLGGANAETNVINFASGIKLFRYYDKGGTELDLDADQGLIPTVRRIEITVAVETSAIDPNTKNKRKMIYSTTTIVRNHVLSP
jgi:prepilin-type N-terminal cleavage/methylation domain-containing protein